MDIAFSQINEIFKKRTLNPNGALKPAAVLLPLFEENGEIKLLITQRALDLDRQPGISAFQAAMPKTTSPRKKQPLEKLLKK